MPNYMTDVNAKDLLKSLTKADLVSSVEENKLGEFIIAQQQEKELPLYLRILVGIGAFIASLCFIGFLSASNIIDFKSESGLIFWGIIFIASAIFLALAAGDKDDNAKHSFLMQTSFCSMGMGKLLFVLGFAEIFAPDKGIGVIISTLIVTLASYNIYKMSIDRFLSSLAVFTTILYNIVSERYLGDISEITLNIFFLGQILLAAYLFTSGKIKRDYMPLAYAVAASLCITVIFFAVESKITYGMLERSYSLTYVNTILTVTLIALIGWASGNLAKLQKEPLMLASLGAIVLGIVSAPGIILSLCLMILGYAKHENLLSLAGILLMPVFLFLYYYNLDISLLAKSEILIASGCVLLAGRGYLHFRQLDKEIVS